MYDDDTLAPLDDIIDDLEEDFIDDEEGFLKMLAEISEYPFDLFNHSDKNNDYLMHLFESGTIKFETKKEEDNFLATIFPNK